MAFLRDAIERMLLELTPLINPASFISDGVKNAAEIGNDALQGIRTELDIFEDDE